MIISFLLLILGAIVQFFVYVLGQLQWNFPGQILSALNVVVSILHILGQLLPWIGDIIAIFLILVPAWVIRYVFKILLWLWGLVPWIGTRTDIPTSDIHVSRSFGSKTWESRIDKHREKASVKVGNDVWKKY